MVHDKKTGDLRRWYLGMPQNIHIPVKPGNKEILIYAYPPGTEKAAKTYHLNIKFDFKKSYTFNIP